MKHRFTLSALLFVKLKTSMALEENGQTELGVDEAQEISDLTVEKGAPRGGNRLIEALKRLGNRRWRDRGQDVRKQPLNVNGLAEEDTTTDTSDQVTVESRTEVGELSSHRLNELKAPEVNFVTPLIEDSKPVTFKQILSAYFPEAVDLNGEQSHRLHAEFLAQATTEVRELIHQGSLDGLSSEDTFEVIARVHQGRNPLEHVVAYYDPTLSPGYADEIIKPNLSSVAVEMGIAKKPEEDTRGFEFGSMRKRNLNMSRGGGEFMISVPVDVLPEIRDQFFSKVDEMVDKYKIQWKAFKAELESSAQYDYSEKSKIRRKLSNLHREVIVSTSAAAMVADFVHFKADCNGRTSEDWGVEIQRRIFGNEDIDKIRTWVQDNMRAKDEDELVKEEYLTDIKKGNELIQKRSSAIKEFRKYVMKEFLDRIDAEGTVDDRQLLVKIQRAKLQDQEEVVNRLTDELLLQRPDIVIDIMLDTISQLGGNESYQLGLPGYSLVAQVDTYEYRKYDTDEVFKEPPTIGSFDQLHERSLNRFL